MFSVNNINNAYVKPKLSFSGDGNTSKDKDYYTCTIDKCNLTGKNFDTYIATSMLGSCALLVGLSVLHAKCIYKYLDKAFNKNIYKTIANFALGGAYGAVSFGLFPSLLVQTLTKNIKLKPIPEAEQAQKEAKIKNTVNDLAKQMNIKINGVCFYDLNKKYGKATVLAAFDHQTGYLILHSKFKDTDLDIKEADPFIVHELTHAKQYTDISRAKDGLYDVNKILIITEVKNLSQEDKNEILNTKDEDISALAQKNISNADKTSNLILVNEEIDKKCEINRLKAIKMYLNNPDVSKYDLPVILDEDYYKKASEGKPPLSQEEILKVASYLDYMQKDSSIYSKKEKLGKSIKVTSNYVNDPMEKEAFKAQFEYIKTGKVT